MSNCRICKGKLKKIINFGKIALVGNFFRSKKSLKKFNISLNFCLKCKHLQISEILNQNVLFKNYVWETGVSKSNIDLIRNLIRKFKKYGVKKESQILEIASNDGSLLHLIKKKYKCFVLGVDPAKNLKSVAEKKKVKSLPYFFNFPLSKKIKKKYNSFDIIIARNVIAHVPKPNEIFKGVNNLLNDEGIFILEVPHLLNIIKDNQYDNIFHEHIGFHSLKSIIDLSNKNGLRIFDVEKINSQGGSIRCFLCKNYSIKKSKKIINKLINVEKKLGLFSNNKLINFKKRILLHIKLMNKLIKKLKFEKKKISIYGASGKGQALLQYCKLNNSLIDYAFDKSEKKQGCYTPGTNILVKSPKDIQKSKTEYILLLSWNIKEEIMKQEKNFLKSGGKFIVPFPSPRIISK